MASCMKSLGALANMALLIWDWSIDIGALSSEDIGGGWKLAAFIDLCWNSWPVIYEACLVFFGWERNINSGCRFKAELEFCFSGFCMCVWIFIRAIAGRQCN